jgi:hypothetical protein
MSDIEVGEEVIVLAGGGIFPTDDRYAGFVGKLRTKETYDHYATVHCHTRLGDYIVVTAYARATPLLKALF